MPFDMKPILFKSEMVRAILDGSKTQTRRIIKNSINPPIDYLSFLDSCFNDKDFPIDSTIRVGSKYQVDDILYVRETFRPFSNITMRTEDVGIEYKADGQRIKWFAEVEDAYSAFDNKWKPSIFLPKKFSRIFLKVVDVRVERIQEITETDAVAEGVKPFGLHAYTCYNNDDYSFPYAKDSFYSLWDSINSKRGYSWESNPWVFVYEFKRIDNPTNMTFRVED